MSGFGKKLKHFIENIESCPERSGAVRGLEIVELLKRLPTHYVFDFQVALTSELIQRIEKAGSVAKNFQGAAKRVLEVADE